MSDSCQLVQVAAAAEDQILIANHCKEKVSLCAVSALDRELLCNFSPPPASDTMKLVIPSPIEASDKG